MPASRRCRITQLHPTQAELTARRRVDLHVRGGSRDDWFYSEVAADAFVGRADSRATDRPGGGLVRRPQAVAETTLGISATFLTHPFSLTVLEQGRSIGSEEGEALPRP